MSRDKSDLAGLLHELATAKPGEASAVVAESGAPADTCRLLCDELDRLAMRDLAAAVSAGGRLVEAAQHVGDAQTKCRAHRSWAQALAYANRFEKSLEQVQQAIAAAREAALPVEVARAQLSSIHALARLGRYDEAIAAGEAAREVFAQHGETPLMARASANLGVTHRMRDDPAAALRYFDEAIELLADDQMASAQLQSNRAEALLDLHQFSDAEAAFHRALECFEQIGALRAAAIVEGNLADLASRQGRLEEALAHFERAIAAMRRGADAQPGAREEVAPGDVARLQAEEAESLSAAGAWREAVELYEQAIGPLRESAMAWEQARALAGLGSALAMLGRDTEAERCLHEAADQFIALGHPTGSARARLALGELAMRRGRADDARAMIMYAQAQLIDRPIDEAIACHMLGRLALVGGNLLAAEHFLEQAVTGLEERSHAPALAEVLQTRAALRASQGRTEQAIEDLRQAVATHERTRGLLPAGRLRTAYLAQRVESYERLVAALLADAGSPTDTWQEPPGRAGEAFAAAERARGRALLDMMSGAIVTAGAGEAPSVRPGESDVLREVADLRQQLNALYATLEELSPNDRRAVDQHGMYESIEQYESRLALAESRLAAHGGVGELFAEPAGVAEVAAALPHDAALVEFFITGDSVSSFVVRDGKLHARYDLSDHQTVDELVEQFRFQLSRALARVASGYGSADGKLDAVLTAAHDELIAPLQSHLTGAKRIFIVPHRGLHLLPFHAMRDEKGQYLIQVHNEVAVLPSASVLVQLAQRGEDVGGENPPGRTAPLIVGVSDETIAGVEREVHSIASALRGADVLYGEEATADHVVAAMAGRPVVHLACHGRFEPQRPMGSGLRLADRWLTVREMYGLKLPGATVTLSACDTGRSVVEAGDELIGLVRGFFAAGASRLVIAMWPLCDKSAEKIMANSYNLWHNRGVPFASALIQAQRTAIEAGMHPALWAPLTLIGTGLQKVGERSSDVPN